MIAVAHPGQLALVTSPSGAARAAPAPLRMWLGWLCGLVPGLRGKVILTRLLLPGARQTQKPLGVSQPCGGVGTQTPQAHISGGSAGAHPSCLLLIQFLLLILFWLLKLDGVICIFLGVYFKDRYYLTL